MNSEENKDQQQIISDIQMSDQTQPTQEPPKSKADETFIVHGKDEVYKLMDAARIMSGQKSSDQMKEEYAAMNQDKSEDIHSHKVPIPKEMFSDFPFVGKENEKDFEYLVGQIIVQFLEKFNDKAIEFPDCLDGGARAHIHVLCNFLGLSSHSTGKGKTRKIYIYPRHLFPKKQETEKTRIAKEKEKLRDKFKDFQFAGVPNDNAVTMREKLIREIYYEQKGLEDPNKEVIWDGPLEPRIEELKKKLAVHSENMKKIQDKFEKDQKVKEEEQTKKNSKFEESREDCVEGKAKVFKYVGNTQPKDPNEETKESDDKDSVFVKDKKEKEVDSDIEIDSEELEDEYFEMTEEQKLAYKEALKEKKERIKKIHEEEYLKRESFQKQLKETTLKTFKDKPDEVRRIRCIHSESHTIAIEWDPPSDNNCPITSYTIYLSNKKITTKLNHQFQGDVQMDQPQKDYQQLASVNDTYYEIVNLDSDTCYYIIVTAQNELGEGYKCEPFLIKTTALNFQDQLCTPYVWGNNTNSELGLSDDQVKENNQSYIKHSMRKVIKNRLFEKGGIIQVAAGNCQSLFLYVDKESKTQSVIQSGITTIPIDEACQQIVFRKNEVFKIQDIPSIPFQIDFDIPVVKVVCGDLFAGLLTAEGEVFTWGYNIYGQLGIKDQDIAAVLQPKRVTFSNPKDKIIDITCGFNHCLALNDSKQVYTWGRRMGVYPQFDFSYHGIKNSQNEQLHEINQDYPKFLKGNLVYYKINKIRAGPGNSALITDNGELLMQGINDQGQLGIGQELGKNLFFFSEFMKKDYFSQDGLKVLDIGYGLLHTLVLCFDSKIQKNRLFGCGLAEFGQLGFQSGIPKHDFIELTDKIPGEIDQISAGSFHSLFLTKDQRLFGCGKNSKGQLGFKFKGKDNKCQHTPIEIKLSDQGKPEIVSIQAGSLFSMALCR